MHLCRLNWTGRTLPYRHRIKIPTPGGLRASTLLLGHRRSLKYWILTSEQRRNIFFFKSWIPERGIRLKAPIHGTGIRPNHYTRAPALKRLKCWRTVLYLKVVGPTTCQHRVMSRIFTIYIFILSGCSRGVIYLSYPRSLTSTPSIYCSSVTKTEVTCILKHQQDMCPLEITVWLLVNGGYIGPLCILLKTRVINTVILQSISMQYRSRTSD